MVLTSVEPATARRVLRSGCSTTTTCPATPRAGRRSGPKSSWRDVVLTDEEIVRHRVPGPPLSSYMLEYPATTSKWSTYWIVGSMKYDGQKIFMFGSSRVDLPGSTLRIVCDGPAEDRAAFTRSYRGY